MLAGKITKNGIEKESLLETPNSNSGLKTVNSSGALALALALDEASSGGRKHNKPVIGAFQIIRTRLLNPKKLLRHFFITAFYVTILILSLIALKFSDVLPSSEVYDHVWYTDKFRLRFDFNDLSRVKRQIPDLVLWDDILNIKQSSPSSSFLNSDTHDYFTLESHTHTTHSDGNLMPPQLVDWAISYGFDILFVTDHNEISGGLAAVAYVDEHELNDEILVIPGVEYTCCRIHMNLVGINQTIAPTESFPSDDELKAVILKTHELGGIVVVNHLPWSNGPEHGYTRPQTTGTLDVNNDHEDQGHHYDRDHHICAINRLQDHPTREQLYEWGVDAVESVSEGIIDLDTVMWSHKMGLPLLSSTDLHDSWVTPKSYTVLKMESSFDPEFTMRSSSSLSSSSSVKHLTRQAVLDRLRRKTKNNSNPQSETESQSERVSSFFYSSVGPKQIIYPVPNPRYEKFYPLTSLDFTYFWTEEKGMYGFNGEFCHERKFTLHWLRIIWFLIWAIGAWVTCEVIYCIILVWAGPFL